MRVRRIAGACLGVWLVAGCPGAEALPPPHRAGATGTPAQAPGDVERAEALRIFNQRLAVYVALRARFEEPLPAFDNRRDPWSLILTRQYLAAAIRSARAKTGQGQGDIFTPRVAAIFRVMVTHTVYDQDIEGMVDSPFGGRDVLVDLVVNEPVPEWAMTKVPAALLAALPALPEAIEYRFVDGALILWDVHAEILIDWLADPVLLD